MTHSKRLINQFVELNQLNICSILYYLELSLLCLPYCFSIITDLPAFGFLQYMIVISKKLIISRVYFGTFSPYLFFIFNSSTIIFSFRQFYFIDYIKLDAKFFTASAFGSIFFTLYFEYTSEMESSIWSCFLPLLILLLNSPVDSVSFFESSRLNNFSLNPESYFFLLVIPPRLFKLALLDEQACVKKSSCFLRYAFYLYNDSFILFSISILYC